MKSNLIKIGSVCIIGTLLFTACVKKEKPEQEESKTEQTTAVDQSATQTTPVEPEFTPLEDVTQATAEPLISASSENSTATTDTNVTPAPRAIPRQEPAVDLSATPISQPQQQVAVANEPAQQATTSAQAPRDRNEAASVDDAIAEAMKAAQPAIQQ